MKSETGILLPAPELPYPPSFRPLGLVVKSYPPPLGQHWEIDLADAISRGASFENSQFFIFAFHIALQPFEILTYYGSAYSERSFTITSSFLNRLS